MEINDVKKQLKDYARILISLNEAGIVRTYNSPVGDYAEWLVSQKMDLTLQGKSEKGFDALDEQTGLKYEVKCRWMHSANASRRLSVIRGYTDKLFDYLIAVIFNKDFEVAEVYRIPHYLIGRYFKVNRHVNGVVVNLTKKFLSDPQVEDITEQLK